MSFAQLLEKQFQEIRFREGEVLKGEVVDVGSDYVTVDIGYKSEGIIPIGEFRDARGEIRISKGEKIDVYLDRIEDDYGLVVLSKEKADMLKAWDEVGEVVDRDEVIEGTIVARVKGGWAVDIGVKAFLPGSQIDLRPVSNPDQYIGRTYKFKVIKFNKKRGNIVLSRRVLLEQERAQLKEGTLTHLSEGQIVTGMVKNITDYGAFIDLGGIDGLLHITDMAWGRIRHPSEVLSIGDELRVKILNYDRERERVSLGLKQLLPDPWQKAADRYPVGKRVSGKVVSITDYGAFVELENGIEGLIHVSEMSWSKKITHPSKAVSVGEVVEVVILNVDESNKRISLGLKQAEPNPWEMLAQKYPSGTVIKGAIKNVTDFGIFVGVEEGIDGLIHVSDLSWTEKVEDPRKLYHRGQEIEAVVLQIDPENQRFSLGLKQLQPDPWPSLNKKYGMGKIVEAPIQDFDKEKLTLALESPLVGLIVRKEFPPGKGFDEMKGEWVPGKVISAMVIGTDFPGQKVFLSIRAMEKKEEREAIAKYRESAEDLDARTNLGELIQNKQREKEEKE
ncbi:MAG: 30S ribosomal protein S1 [Deltaproteobacteria bacterium]|nr:30S ribosomal protein S1 [Deltaproteobacteria bacterium]